MAVADRFSEDSLIKSVVSYVREYMSKYDASHSFEHIERVVGVARYIYAESGYGAADPVKIDERIVVLAALLHDVGDRKYIQPGEDATTLVKNLLLSLGTSAELAERVQTICLGVSYSSEAKNPGHVQQLLVSHPELAIVQDADRLDAIGAIGIGRCFTFGGAKTVRSMEGSITHFDEKLLLIEGMMKTEVGRKLARERTERLSMFKAWWKEESAFGHGAGLDWMNSVP